MERISKTGKNRSKLKVEFQETNSKSLAIELYIILGIQTQTHYCTENGEFNTHHFLLFLKPNKNIKLNLIRLN